MKSEKGKQKKLKFYPTEVFKEISFEGKEKFQPRYAISNHGRLVSFFDKIEYGKFLYGSQQKDCIYFRYTVKDENNKVRYKNKCFHRLVAESFISKISDNQIYVLHLDRNRFNNKVDNLKWATESEMIEHRLQGSNSIPAKKKQFAEGKLKGKWSKFTLEQIIHIKKQLLDPNFKRSQIIELAKEHGVNEHTLYRIRRGENWGDIKV